MKKNAVGHMMLPKENATSFLRRSHILPKLLCLLSAIVIWLLIVNLAPTDHRNDNNPSIYQLQDAASDSFDL